MALYIKANPLVAAHLNVDRLRLKLSDGNYLLWQADMLAFGKLYEIPQICGRIGALPLQPWEARQEQDGSVLRPLPVATDDRFIMPGNPSKTKIRTATAAQRMALTRPSPVTMTR